MPEPFSDRHGYRGAEREITVREDAPEGLRYAIPLVATDAGMTPKGIRQVACQILLVPPDRNNWSDPNVRDEVSTLMAQCPWFNVYDIAEGLYAALASYPAQAKSLQDRLNRYFAENGIGWQMDNGKIGYRGSEAFADATHEATVVLEQTGRRAAASEIHEALRDISRRPTPDVTGAIQHSIAALECTARDVTGEPNLTLGRLASRLQLVPPLDTAVEKLWGYASERARHIREGQVVETDEAELVVSIACAVCTFLARRRGP
jgi:hypothetical protein